MSGRKSSGSRGGVSGLPVPKASKGSPHASTSQLSRSRGSTMAKSAENLALSPSSHPPSQVPTRRALSPGSPSPRRALSPGVDPRKSLSPLRATGSTLTSPVVGVRYITEDLIRKLGKENTLEEITTLNLTLSREGGKKIKYIEGLDRLRKVQMLNLSNNMIERIERLEKLTGLRELNLSYNRISRIEGLETLTGLQTLNLSGNLIEHIPNWVPKKLKALRAFRIASNKIASLGEIVKLKPIVDLVQLDVHDNPLCDLPHWRLYLVFHLRTVELLDGHPVSPSDRSQAEQRFALNEVERLEKQLEQQSSRVQQLEADQSRSLMEKSQSDSMTQGLRAKERQSRSRLEQVEQELTAKNDLLKKKTEELNKACEKHYQLEQELAFYKIDSKFDSLREAPQFAQDADDSGRLDESPYIGRARYRANQYAGESYLSASPQRATVHSLSADSSGMQPPPEEAAERSRQLDQELTVKKQEVEKVEEQLRTLHKDLERTEWKLKKTTEELKTMSDRKTPEPFRDDEKFKIRQRLARKMKSVNELRDGATQMESEIDQTQETIQRTRAQIAAIKDDLRKIDTSHPHFHTKTVEVESKEKEVVSKQKMYSALQGQLEHMLDNISQETEDIKRLEIQLNEDQLEQNEALRAELDDIVAGLQGYLGTVKEQSKQQAAQLHDLTGERDRLAERVSTLESELSILDSEAGDGRTYKKRVRDLEESLLIAEGVNQELRDELHRSRQLDPELQDRLEHAEVEWHKLKGALGEAEKNAQAERQTLEKQLKVEKEKSEKLSRKIKDTGARDKDEIKRLVAQLEAAKALNASLRDQVEEGKQAALSPQREDKDSFKPSDLKRKLREFAHTFKTGKVPIKPEGEGDILGKTFHELQSFVQDRLQHSDTQAKKAQEAQKKAEKEMQTLKQELKKAEGKMVDKKTETAGKENLAEMQRMKDEIKRLQNALKEAEKRAKQGGPPKTRIVYAPSTDSEVDRASSLNSDERQLYDELQRELMDLKNYMRRMQDESLKKVADAENEAAEAVAAMARREEQLQEQLDRQQQEGDLLREKQEARIQVIAQDLDSAQGMVEQLQNALSAHRQQLQAETSNADMSNQMISAQEEELARLYEILEVQRGELENLNAMLDHLAQHGPDGVGPGFDDELWRLRQEVNGLKETLAMQSAYVQAMPPSASMATQAGGVGPSVAGGMGTSMGTQAGVGPWPNVVPHFYHSPPRGHSGRTGGAGASGPQGRSSRPTTPGLPGSSPFGDAGFLPAQPSSAPLPPTPGSVYTTPFAPPSLPPPGMAADMAQGIAPTPTSASLPFAPPSQRAVPLVRGRSNQLEHITNERREAKAPPGGKPVAGRDHVDAGPSSNKGRDGSGHSSRPRGHRAERPSAFERVHRPQPHLALYPPPAPQYAPPAQYGPPPPPAAAVPPVPAPPPGSYPAGGVGAGMPVYSQGMQGAGGRGVPQPPHVAGGHPIPLPYPQGSASYPQVPPPYPQVVAAPYPQVVHPTPQMPVPGVPPPGVVQPGQGMVGYPADDGFLSSPPHSPTHAPQFHSPQPGAYPYPDAGEPAVVYYSPTARPLQYVPVGTAHPVGYRPGRVYFTAGGDVRPGRLYYPINGGQSPPSPGPRPGSIPVTPVATGTPISDRSVSRLHFDDSFIDPPSPIRPVAMESPPRGILKNAGGGVVETDEDYLFCNVPEHHDLEDYIAELQEKLKRLKLKIVHDKEREEEVVITEDKKLIRRLQSELEERRDELEGLDLAIERQKKNLKSMREEERKLKYARATAKEELQDVKEKNFILLKRRRSQDADDSFDEAAQKARQTYLTDEIACLEKTLAKRTGQLREVEHSLKSVQEDLKDAREQARDTVKRYDDANSNLANTIRETQEMERRAKDAGLEVIRTSEQLSTVRSELKDLERRKQKQDKLLKDINHVIAKRDAEFKELDSKVKHGNQNLARVQAELLASQQRERDLVETLRDSEEALAKRRAEVSRLRDQIEAQRGEVERLDQAIGQKKTELSLAAEETERKQNELTSVLRDAENEIGSKHQDLRDLRQERQELEQQKADLVAFLKSKRAELQKMKEQVEQEEEVLQKLQAAVGRNKAELKHAGELQRLEATELDSLKAQHAQRLAELERTQRSVLQEKGELETLTAEVARKTAEVERLRQTLERDRAEVEILTTEKKSLEDRILALGRERDAMDENSKAMDDKINTLKRTHRITEEKIETANRRLEDLEAVLQQREREAEEATHQRSMLQKDVNNLKQTVKESRAELQALEEGVQTADERLHTAEQELRETVRRRDEVRMEIERLNGVMRQARQGQEEASRLETEKRQELQDLLTTMEHSSAECEASRKILNKIRKEGEQEEIRLKKQETQKLSIDGEKFIQMEMRIKEVEAEMRTLQEEREELKKDLAAKEEEIQKLHKDSTEDRNGLIQQKIELGNQLQETKAKLNGTQKELRALQESSRIKVQELQDVAEQHLTKASGLEQQINTYRSEALEAKKQLVSQELLTLRLNTLEEALRVEQRMDNAERVLAMEDEGGENKENQGDRWKTAPVGQDSWRREALKDKLVQEQDYLRYQLRQQMLKHAEVMENTRLQSEGTIENLKRKLNNLQNVLFTTDSPDLRAIRSMTRSRSGSRSPRSSSHSPLRSTVAGGLHARSRSRSPGYDISGSFLSRSRSGDRLEVPERDYL